MIFAHAPAGYLLSRFVRPRRGPAWAFMLGGVTPDFDVPYFALFGPPVATHHYYSPLHWPLTWLALGVALLVLAKRAGPAAQLTLRALLAGIALHLCLDTVTWNIYWAAPFDFTPLKLTDPTQLARAWPWNFLTHWTMLLEAGICAAAAWMFASERKGSAGSVSARSRAVASP
ncbi:MAG: metal-dependent hydrolase [Euryhalocaulis sp.]|uniref:metal-dependent hydrolase n=1 Tax=Euryhalocaulis sp. TaxID=2744307 RepID=UPI00181A2004|nr:hypothetical protein [Euryhalocaulis sp.]MBA4800874.1 metal-dependent hydrolase [Euryhalocaulis sp.]